MYHKSVAFIQSQKIPKSEKNLALKNMADYLARYPDTEETK